MTHRRIVQINLGTGGPFENDEVIEIPEQDGWKWAFQNVFGGLTKPFGATAVLFGHPDNVDCVAAVPGNAASHAERIQAFESAEVSQHHAEAGGAALHRLHLENGWRAHAPPGELSGASG